MSRMRYMRNHKTETPKFEWIGDPIEPPKEHRKSNCLHYERFKLSELTIELGDYVIIRNDDDNGHLLNMDVAKVERLFEDSNQKGEPHRAEVTWLCRPPLLPKKLKLGDGIPDLDDKCEVVLESREFPTVMDAETIYFKCQVVPRSVHANPLKTVKHIEKQLEASDSDELVKYPVYVLRFKMVGTKKGKRSFKLVPYQENDGDPSPLKLSQSSRNPLNRTPLKELSRFGEDSDRPSSPEIPKMPKLEIPKELMDQLTELPGKHDLVDGKKRRRLSSRGSSREATPIKRIKKSESVQNTPENASDSPRPRRSVRKSISTNENSIETPSTAPSSPQVSARTSARRTAIAAGLASGGNTPIAHKGTPTRASANNKSVGTPKGSKGSAESSKPQSAVRSSRRSIIPQEKTPVESDNPKKNKTKFDSRKSDVAEKLTLDSQTDSGRKITISFDKPKKIAPSSGLGAGQISDLLHSAESESESDDDDFVKEPKKSKKTKAATSSTSSNKAKTIAKSKEKPAKKKEPEPKEEPVIQKRTRRASMSVAEKPSTTPVTTSRRRSMAVSETKVKKKIETYKTASSESDSDYEIESATSSEEENENYSDAESDDVIRYKSNKSQKARQPAKSKTVFTPRVQQRQKPVPMTCNPMVEAQARLHVSAVPESLPCREEEFAEIFGFIEGKLQEGTGGCIYISGVPGTGKTATVKQVMRYMDENRDDFPEFEFHELNGMRLTCPEQIYVEMWRLLNGGKEKLSSEASLKRLDERFAKAAPKRVPTVFLVDELDMLCKTRKQTVLYNMFEWPSRPQAKLIIVAIANTMDLPERDMDMRVISRLGFNRLNFDPYNQVQLQMIVTSRLQGLQVFQSDEIELVSRKVASLSGDARRALDICRILAERCEREKKERITHQDVLKVHAEMFRSPKIQFIRTCSKMEQFLLRALVNEFYRTGIEETNLRNIVYRMEELCASEGLEVPTLHCIYNICSRLSSQRLILSEDYRKGLETKLRLNVGFDDVNFALRPQADLE